MKNMIEKVWNFLRPAVLPLLILLCIFFSGKYFLSQFKSDRNDFSERMKEMQGIHDAEMKKIIEAQTAENERHEQNLKQLQQDLSVAIEKHEEKLKELERQKEAESKRLFEKYRNDPTGLAQEVSRVTGIPVYVNEGKK